MICDNEECSCHDEIDPYDQAVERELIREANERHSALQERRWLDMCISFWILFLIFMGLGIHKWYRTIWP